MLTQLRMRQPILFRVSLALSDPQAKDLLELF